MNFKDINNENWILSSDNFKCYKMKSSNLGDFWVLGLDDRMYNVETNYKTIFELLSGYQNEEISFGGKSRSMSASEQTIMLAFAMKKLITEYNESFNSYNFKIPIIMTKFEILNLYKIKRYNLERYVIKRLELRKFISRQSKVMYVLTEKGHNYVNLFIRAIKSNPEPSPMGGTPTTFELQSK